jgi:hypothetical protein
MLTSGWRKEKFLAHAVIYTVDHPACSLVTIRPRCSFLQLRARNDREACGQSYESCDLNTGQEMLPYIVTVDRAATVDTLEQLPNAKCLTGAGFTCQLRFYKSSRNFHGHEHTLISTTSERSPDEFEHSRIIEETPRVEVCWGSGLMTVIVTWQHRRCRNRPIRHPGAYFACPLLLD